MNMTRNWDHALSSTLDWTCPFNAIQECKASLSLMKIDSGKKASCCETDDYDNCPIFLAKMLRKC